MICWKIPWKTLDWYGPQLRWDGSLYLSTCRQTAPSTGPMQDDGSTIFVINHDGYLRRPVCHQWQLLYGRNWLHLVGLQRQCRKWSKPFSPIFLVNFWRRRQLLPFDCCQSFITTWSLAKPLNTSLGKFDCLKSSTRIWRKQRPTSQLGPRHSCWELFGWNPRDSCGKHAFVSRMVDEDAAGFQKCLGNGGCSSPSGLQEVRWQVFQPGYETAQSWIHASLGELVGALGSR